MNVTNHYKLLKTKNRLNDSDQDVSAQVSYEDEYVPSPNEVKSDQRVVLPEIQSMDAYIRRHYEAALVADIAMRLHTGELGVRYEGRYYRSQMARNGIATCNEITNTQYLCFADINVLGGSITWASFYRIGDGLVGADLVVEMQLRIKSDQLSAETTERYDIPMTIDMEDGIETDVGFASLHQRNENKSAVQLDEYLIPLFNKDTIEDEVERIIWQVAPDGLQSPGCLNSRLLAERLGLSVVQLPLYKRPKTSSILFFGSGEVQVEPMIGAEDDAPITVPVDENTIVVNSARDASSRDPVFHECFHYVEHRLFFQLQRMHSDDISRLARWKPVTVEKCEKNPIEWLEWQAQYGGQCLQIPRSLLKKRVEEELRIVQNQARHMGHKLHMIGRKLAKEFDVCNYQLRNRLIQVGYGAAKGALNYVGNDYITPFAFSIGECRGAQTFVVTPKDLLDVYLRDESFRDVIDTGRYIYVDGHVCINAPEYVCSCGDKLVLTEWANAHVDQCCLRFTKSYIRDKKTHYVYGQLNSDEDYNGRSLSMAAADKMPKLLQQAAETSKLLLTLPPTFHDAFTKLMDISEVTVEELAEETMMSERSITRYRTEEKQEYAVDTVAVLCVGLHLDPLLSFELMQRAGIFLRNTPEDLVIKAILMGMYMTSVAEISKYLREIKYPRIKNWPADV